MTKQMKLELIVHLERIDDMLRNGTILYPDIKKMNRVLLEVLLEEEEGDAVLHRRLAPGA